MNVVAVAVAVAYNTPLLLSNFGFQSEERYVSEPSSFIPALMSLQCRYTPVLCRKLIYLQADTLFFRRLIVSDYREVVQCTS